MQFTQIFIYLQLLDLLTTLVGFKMGASEASPFIRTLMHVGPVAGVVLSKVVALGIGGVCVWASRSPSHQMDHVLVWRIGGMEFNDHAERAGAIGALNWPWRRLCPQHLTCDTVSSKKDRFEAHTQSRESPRGA